VYSVVHVSKCTWQFVVIFVVPAPTICFPLCICNCVDGSTPKKKKKKEREMWIRHISGQFLPKIKNKLE